MKPVVERGSRLRFGLLALGASATAAAGNFDYQVTAGAAHSDNIARVETGKTEEDIANAGFKFSFDQQTRKIDADLVGNFDYQKFLDDTYDNELIGGFNGNVKVAFVPERFDWTFADNFGQVLVDPFQPSTPLNSENINFFATGPDVTLGLGVQNRLNLGARYLRTDYEDSPFDSTTALAQVGYERIMSSVNSLSFNTRFQKVDYETEVFGSDYDQNDAFVRYDGDGARTKITADLGYSELKRDVGDDSGDWLLRLSALRQVSTSSNVSLLAGREFANSGTAFAALQENAPISLDPAAGRQAPEPFLRNHASLAWTFQRRATNFAVRAGIEDQDFAFNDFLDQKFTTLGVSYQRYFSAITNVQLEVARIQGDFSLNGAQYSDINAGATFTWGMTRTLTLALSYHYADRDGDALTGEFTENRVMLSLSFQHGAPRIEPLPPQFGGGPAQD